MENKAENKEENTLIRVVEKYETEEKKEHILEDGTKVLDFDIKDALQIILKTVLENNELIKG